MNAIRSRISFLILVHCLLISEGKKFNSVQIGKIFEAAVKGFPLKIEFSPETLQCQQVIQIEKGKNTTKYFLVQGNEEPDIKGTSVFARKRDDTGKPWVLIPKAQDHLYKWETQTMVILRQTNKNPKVYSILMVHVREIGTDAFVFEWDKWRPRGKYPVDECSCTMVDKFYHPCENWDYCKLVANVYEISNDTSIQRRRRRETDKKYNKKTGNMPKIPTKKDNDSEKTADTGNEIPKGSVAAFGPFFWDIVDTPEEAFETNARIKKYQTNKNTSAKSYEDTENVPFSGYGDCPYEVKDEEIKQVMTEKGKDSKKRLEFYFKTMRAQCMETEKSDVQTVINSKLLLWNDTLEHFVLNRNNHPLMKKPSVSDDELDQMEMAMHFASYSFMYPTIVKRITQEKEKNNTHDSVTPLGYPIHRNTRMIVLMTLRIFDMIRRDFGHHEIKLTRRLISNLKNHLMLGLHSRMAFSAESAKNPKMCKGEGSNNTCTKTKEMFKKDTLQPIALTYFILFGNDPTAPPEIRRLDTYTKFVQFYQYRIQFLEHHFSNYGVVGS